MSENCFVEIRGIRRDVAEKHILTSVGGNPEVDFMKFKAPDNIEDLTTDWMRENWGSESNAFDTRIVEERKGSNALMSGFVEEIDILNLTFECKTAPPVEVIEALKDECNLIFYSRNEMAFEDREITFIDGVDRKTVEYSYNSEYEPEKVHIEVKDKQFDTVYSKTVPADEYSNTLPDLDDAEKILESIKRGYNEHRKDIINRYIPDLVIKLVPTAASVCVLYEEDYNGLGDNRRDFFNIDTLLNGLQSALTERSELYREGYAEEMIYVAEQLVQGEEEVFTSPELKMDVKNSPYLYFLYADGSYGTECLFSTDKEKLFKKAVEMYKEEYDDTEEKEFEEMQEAYYSSMKGRFETDIPYNYHPRDEELLSGKPPKEEEFVHEYTNIRVCKDLADGTEPAVILSIRDDEEFKKAEKMLLGEKGQRENER